MITDEELENYTPEELLALERKIEKIRVKMRPKFMGRNIEFKGSVVYIGGKLPFAETEIFDIVGTTKNCFEAKSRHNKKTYFLPFNEVKQVDATT